MHELLLSFRSSGSSGLDLVAEAILFAAPRMILAHGIDELSMGSGCDPRRRIGGDAVFGPAGERGGEGLLHRLFCAIEGSGDADQGRNNPSRFLAEHGFREGTDISH